MITKEELKVGGEYVNSKNDTLMVLFVDENIAFYRWTEHGVDYNNIRIEDFLEEFSLPKKKIDPDRDVYYIWRYKVEHTGKWNLTDIYQNKEFFADRPNDYHICTEFKPILADGSYYDVS